MSDMDSWKIGTLATTCGVSVRTLRHWDAIGLLSPAGRTPAGHRVYTEADLGRLYRILALRPLGLGLDTIAEALAGDVDMAVVVAEHVAAVERSLASLTELQAHLRRIEAELADGGPVDIATMLTAMTAADDARPDRERVLREHLTDEQLQHLATAAEEVGPAAPYLLEIEWPSLYARADALRMAGVPPDDPAMQEIASRMHELAARFGGDGDSTQPSAVRTAWRDDPVAMSGDPLAVEKGWGDLAEYVDRALLIVGSAIRR